jgi:hypothetical protein
MYNQVEATKHQLKTAIDDALSALKQYEEAIEALQLPELPPDLADLGKPYNDIAQYLDGYQKPID